MSASLARGSSLLLLLLLLVLLLPNPLLLLDFPGKVNRHQYRYTVQSAPYNLIDLERNFDLRGPGGRKILDLDDGEDELVGLGLVGSRSLMRLSSYILIRK